MNGTLEQLFCCSGGQSSRSDDRNWTDINRFINRSSMIGLSSEIQLGEAEVSERYSAEEINGSWSSVGQVELQGAEKLPPGIAI